MNKMVKYCIVPTCSNSSEKTPKKLFISVPYNKNTRKKWLKAMDRPALSLTATSHVHCCEDHFDLPNDMENYMVYHVMGSVSQVRMKPGCVPTKFDCQKEKTFPTILKKQKNAVAKKHVQAPKETSEDIVKAKKEKARLRKQEWYRKRRERLKSERETLKVLREKASITNTKRKGYKRKCSKIGSTCRENNSETDSVNSNEIDTYFEENVSTCSKILLDNSTEHLETETQNKMCEDSTDNLDTEVRNIVCKESTDNLQTEALNIICENATDSVKTETDSDNENEKLCLICLDIGSEMYNIVEQSFMNIYEQFTGTEMKKEDRLPQSVCRECIRNLISANHFRQRALKSRQFLISRLSVGEFITEEDLKEVKRNISLDDSRMRQKLKSETFFNDTTVKLESNDENNEAHINDGANIDSTIIDKMNVDDESGVVDVENIGPKVKEEWNMEEHFKHSTSSDVGRGNEVTRKISKNSIENKNNSDNELDILRTGNSFNDWVINERDPLEVNDKSNSNEESNKDTRSNDVTNNDARSNNESNINDMNKSVDLESICNDNMIYVIINQENVDENVFIM